MGRSPSNPNVPQIPTPLANLGSLVNVCQALKQGVDSLGGSRGNALDRAVTLNDLVAMGVLTQAAAQSLTGQAGGGSGASGASGASALSQLSDVSLGALANGQVLTYDSTAAKWKNIAAAGGGGGFSLPKLTQVAIGSNISASSWTQISWNVVDLDEVGAWVSSSPTVITVPAGYNKARLTANLSWTNTGSARYAVLILTRGGTDYYLACDIRSAPNEGLSSMLSPWVSVQAGDTLCMRVTGGGTLVGAANDSAVYGGRTRLQVEWAAASSTSPASVAVVQSVAATSTGNVAFTLPSAPTPGNMLVFIGGKWSTAGAPANGYQQLFAQSASNDIAIIYYKKVLAGDTVSQTPITGTGGSGGVLYELNGVWGISAQTADDRAWVDLVGSTALLIPAVPRAGSLVLLVLDQQGSASPISLSSTNLTTGASVSGTNTRAVASYFATGAALGFAPAAVMAASSGHVAAVSLTLVPL